MKYDRTIYEDRLGSFQHDLTALSAQDLKPLPDLSATLDHQGGEPTPVTLEPGFYVTPKVLHSLTAKYAGTKITMTPDDGQKMTREDSRHQVFLGYLDFVDAGTESTVYEANVAVKAEKALQKELAMYQYMGGLGLSTFKPFGFIVMQNGNQHLLTKVQRSVITIDATEWKLLSPEEIVETVRSCVETELCLNSQMLFHGDLEFRNVATRDDGSPVIVDPEYMTSFREIGDELVYHLEDIRSLQVKEVKVCLNAIARKMNSDFTAMAASVRDLVLPALPHKIRPKNSTERFSTLKKMLYDPYRDRLTQDTPYYSVLRHAFDSVLLTNKEEARRGII